MNKKQLKNKCNEWCLKNYKKFGITKKEAKEIFKGVKMNKQEKESLEKCFNCIVNKPCILNCPYKTKIIKGKHYLEECN